MTEILNVIGFTIMNFSILRLLDNPFNLLQWFKENDKRDKNIFTYLYLWYKEKRMKVLKENQVRFFDGIESFIKKENIIDYFSLVKRTENSLELSYGYHQIYLSSFLTIIGNLDLLQIKVYKIIDNRNDEIPLKELNVYIYPSRFKFSNDLTTEISIDDFMNKLITITRETIKTP